MAQSERVSRLRMEMAARGLDAYFVAQPLNVYYLSGFRPMTWTIVQPADDPEGFMVVERDHATFLCDDRYDASPAKANGADHVRIPSPAGVQSLSDAMLSRIRGRVKRLGYESGSLIHADALGLMAAMPGIEWVMADELLVQQRIAKDDAEKELLRKAAQVTDGACAHALGKMRVGMTEHELAQEIADYLRRHSDGLSFSPIVAFGAASASPHYEPSHTNRLKAGDLVLMDLGANYGGYMGDLTRMAVMGKATDKMKKVYALVLEAQEAVLAGLRPGMQGQAADKLARDAFEKRGVLDKYLHGTGHGIGLAIHEPPRLKTTFENPLVPGSVFSVEPGLYEAGFGGMRIEDVVIMGVAGPENITHSPKRELIEVG